MTEEKHSPGQQKKSEQEIAKSFDSISCGLCIYRIEGERLFPLFRNRAFYDIMGFSEENLQRLDHAGRGQRRYCQDERYGPVGQALF